ncbi:acetyl-CoA carboxylase biotin carboxyl carrier protein [Vallitalea pronyensis]|nr:acetyl-CoA carboxylase biotin carboxyl carrier protein [Vallitalea pronyensis]
MKFEQIKELIELVDEKKLTRIDIEEEDFKITIRKEYPKVVASTGDADVQPVPSIQPVIQQVSVEPGSQVTTNELEADENLFVVESPMVGTFYSAKSPEAEDFVKVGDQVTEGATLCIIEAMKLMNDIDAEVSGQVVEILVKNEEPVEYGQPLFKLKAQ